ncbi:MAG: transglutaminase domain-containing protein [Bacteroidales bacterium]|nr:transglutaminase domain-containing protein [Bacteroidales bacterium]
MKSRLLVIMSICLCIAMVFCGCTRRRGPSRKREQTHKQAHPVNQRDLKLKHDTIYMIVPMPAEKRSGFDAENAEIVFPTTKKLKPLIHDKDLPSPPKIEFSRPQNICSRDQYVNCHEITGEMKELVVACDYDNSTVRNNAVALVSISPGPFNLGQLCDIFDFCYGNWSYVNDPIARDYYAKASETLKNGLNGDCDDFAILVCSMILAIGGEARISFAYKGSDGHAFAEVNIGETPREDVENYLLARYGNMELNHKEEDGNWWLNLDWWGQYPGAKYWDYQKGTCFNIIKNIYKELE